MTKRMDLWRAVEHTPPSHTKQITGKAYSGTSPKPHYLVMKATETFGPCGIGWGFTVLSERIEDGAGGDKLHIAHVRVWYIWDGQKGVVEHIGGTPFSGTRKSGASYIDEDAPKKSVTDALVKALSMIGFAADIFIGRYDDSKYVAEARDDERRQEREAGNQAAKRAAQAPDPTKFAITLRTRDDGEPDIERWRTTMVAAIQRVSDIETLRAFWAANRPTMPKILQASQEMGAELVAAYQARQKELEGVHVH